MGGKGTPQNCCHPVRCPHFISYTLFKIYFWSTVWLQKRFLHPQSLDMCFYIHVLSWGIIMGYTIYTDVITYIQSVICQHSIQMKADTYNSIYIQIWNLFPKLPGLGPHRNRYLQLKNTKVQEIQPQITFHDIRFDFIFAYLKACMFYFLYSW